MPLPVNIEANMEDNGMFQTFPRSCKKSDGRICGPVAQGRGREAILEGSMMRSVINKGKYTILPVGVISRPNAQATTFEG
jgi:hypothetical protein